VNRGERVMLSLWDAIRIALPNAGSH
jgi:hypothetical protein